MRPVGLGVLAGLDEVEVGRRREQVGRALRAAMASATILCVSGPNGSRCCGFAGPGLALGVVERPLVERDDRLPRLLDDLLAQLDRLGQDDLLLRGEQGDLADLLEVHPDRVVDPDHVRGERLGLQLLGGGLLDLGGRQLRAGRPRPAGTGTPSIASSLDDLDRRARRVRLVASSGRSSVEVLVDRRPSSTSASTSGRRAPARRPFGPHRWPASPPRARAWLRRVGRETASTSCLSRGSVMVAGSSGWLGRCVGTLGGGGGRAWSGGSACVVSAGGHRRTGEEPGLVAAPVERPALLVEVAALEHQALDEARGRRRARPRRWRRG